MSAVPLPHSFVLADLFDVVAMTLKIPDHIHEDEPGLELVACPECGGQGWLECHGCAYAVSLSIWGRPDLDFVLKPCTRCHTTGEVLSLLEPAPSSRSEPLCERCLDSGWVDAEPTAKTRAAGFRYLLGVAICPCGAWRHAVDRAA